MSVNLIALVSPDGAYLVTDTPPDTLESLQLSGSASPQTIGTLSNISSAFFSPHGDQLYALSILSSDVAIVDQASGQVEKYIPSGAKPIGIAADVQADRLYVVDQESQNLSVIDAATSKVIRNVVVPLTSGMLYAVAAASGNVFIANDENLQMWNPASGAFQYLPFPQDGCLTFIGGMQPTPDRKLLYVTFIEEQSCPPPDIPGTGPAGVVTAGVRVFDAASGNLVAAIPAPNAVEIAFSADGTSAYVGGYIGDILNRVSVIDTQTFQVSRIIPLPAVQSIWGLAVSRDGGTLYLLDFAASQVDVIDVPTGAITTAIPVEAYTGWMAMSPDRSVLYLGNSGNPWLDVLSTVTNSITGRIPLASPATAMAFAPAGAGN